MTLALASSMPCADWWKNWPVARCLQSCCWIRAAIAFVTAPLWDDYRDLALPHGLRACWSTPILSSEGRVLGTFATYYREPHIPTAQEHHVVERVTHLASIVIEGEQAEEALRQAQTEIARASRVTTMGELTASLAHEVNQPIAAAITDANTCLRWLAGDTPKLEEAREA